ncbi:MAG: putative esterase of the alpha/beta hydrolase fold family [Betaproteobacteria bacterium]|nr:putative esterase of the alpha/beta hydrolase fold family [Betaproteobacteria bacterium]
MHSMSHEDHAVLLVPGLHGSGPDHWQTHWQREHPEYGCVTQKDWDIPSLEDWVSGLGQEIRATRKPVLLVAHSFGCLVAVRQGVLDPRGILGALLVAPANPDRFEVTWMLPIRALGFPTIVVASDNDPWMPLVSAQWWAERWGSRFVNVGAAGHINAESGVGAWPLGAKLFADLKSAALTRIAKGADGAGDARDASTGGRGRQAPDDARTQAAAFRSSQ